MQVTNLRGYLATIGMEVREFAQLIECTPTYTSGIVSGRLIPGKRLARDIKELTNGVIDFTTVRKEKNKINK